jgi:hypothetical protein
MQTLKSCPGFLIAPGRYTCYTRWGHNFRHCIPGILIQCVTYMPSSEVMVPKKSGMGPPLNWLLLRNLQKEMNVSAENSDCL